MYARLAPSCWIVWEVPLHTLHLSSYLVWQTPAGMDPVLPWSVSLACLSVQLCPVTGRISGSQTRLNGKNKIWAIICTLPIVRYPAGRISWPKEAIEVTHIKTRRLLTVLGGFQPKSSTLTLSGRKWAESMKQTNEYIRLLHWPITVGEHLRQQKPRKEGSKKRKQYGRTGPCTTCTGAPVHPPVHVVR